ncbi:zonadhesin, partial [Elysia marginata]
MAAVWLAGNLDVLGFDKRTGKAPFQVDPPRMADKGTFRGQSGCFQAVTVNGKLSMTLKDCETPQPYICEYDPLDFIGVRTKGNKQQAIQYCRARGRPVATILNRAQQWKATQIVKTMGGTVWLSLEWNEQQSRYYWQNGAEIGISNWRSTPQPNSRGRQYYCVVITAAGFWYTKTCTEQHMVLCGPPLAKTPEEFTPHIPVDGFNSLVSLYNKLKNHGREKEICQNPKEIECSAQNNRGVWVNSADQNGNTLVCTKGRIMCRPNREFKCNTYRVRLLCPQETDQCDELKTLGATACDGGQECTPVRNHYVCRCPPNSQYNPHTKRCSSFCGKCLIWGDPHYHTISSDKGVFDFMGMCKYRVAGVCEADKDLTSPSFDVITTNKACGRSASCINILEVYLTNMPVRRNGVTRNMNFHFKFHVGASAYYLDGRRVDLPSRCIPGVLTATVKRAQFTLVVQALDVTVFLSGVKLIVSVPGQFRHKMCGLCGDCGVKGFKLKNGTVIEPRKTGHKWDRNQMVHLASDWTIYDENSEFPECRDPGVTPPPVDPNECTAEQLAEIRSNKKCGIFLDPASPLKGCLDATGLDAQEYFDGCVFDACAQGDPEASVCNSVKTFVQECFAKNFFVDWRSPTFCPMECEGNKEYRVDASCEPTCGQRPISSIACDEPREEGCVCPSGLLRSGDKCVPAEECGCTILVEEDNQAFVVKPGESALMPGCTEKVTCVAQEDGSSQPIFETVPLLPSEICNDGPPGTTTCARGFSKKPGSDKCEKDKTCIEGFTDDNGLCIHVPEEPKIWRQAVEACNEKDGTLSYVDTVTKLNSLKAIMKEKGYESLYVSGRLRAVKTPRGFTRFIPLVPKEERGKVKWANFDMYEEFIEKISLSPEITQAQLARPGIRVSLVAKLKGEEVELVAVTSNTPSHFVCTQRNTPEDEEEWFGPCNTDTDMADGGDEETRYNMVMDPECLVCPKPMDVRCEPANPRGPGNAVGRCGPDVGGKYYSCDQGVACKDMKVSTKCSEDVDECAERLHDCPQNSNCINTPGAYICKCRPAFPLMVNGECRESKTCFMVGPNSPSEHVHRIRGFSKQLAIFDYDCKFKLATICQDAPYNPASGLPRFSVFLIGSRVEGALQPVVAGFLFDPATGNRRRWAVTPQTLKKASFMYGTQPADSVLTSTAFSDPDVKFHFFYAAPGTLIIRHYNDHVKATIMLARFPPRIKLEYSAEYEKLLCGVCAIPPETPGAKLELTEDQITEVSVGARTANRTTHRTATTTYYLYNVSESPTEYEYSITGFDNKPAIFDYNCKFRMTQICRGAVITAASGLPQVSVSLVGNRVRGALRPVVVGWIRHVASNTVRRLVVSAASLQAGRFIYGATVPASSPRSAPYTDSAVEFEYTYDQAEKVFTARQLNDLVKITVSLAEFPPMVKVEYSAQYRNKLCGVCSYSPENAGDDLILTEQQITDISLGP